MAINFGQIYDENFFKIWEAILIETKLYLKRDWIGGWSSFYCKAAWNDSTLENDVNLDIFDLLLEIDKRNGANPSTIVLGLCNCGAFEAIKVT